MSRATYLYEQGYLPVSRHFRSIVPDKCWLQWNPRFGMKIMGGGDVKAVDELFSIAKDELSEDELIIILFYNRISTFAA